jgi:DNase/tRNase domain of colicin-like bacteriocin
MVVFRKLGKVVNITVGEAAKGGVNLISRGVSTKNEEIGKYIGEVGNCVVDASKGAVDSIAQFSDGAVRSGYGVVKKDEYQKQRGFHDLKDSTGRTIKGMGSSIKYTVKSAGITVRGLKNQDREQVIDGLKNLGKVAAVTTFAVGVIDIVDGTDSAEAESIETRNDHLNGNDHAETGIPFKEQTVELLSGEVYTGTFPIFESDFSVILTEDVYLATDTTHFSIANETLYQSIQENPELVDKLALSPLEVEELKLGHTPDGYVWHHAEQPGVLQLVDEEVHQNTGHTGGREVWGGGSEYR